MAEVKDNSSIQLFEDQKIRTAWDAEKEEWYFSIIDVISVLTDTANPRRNFTSFFGIPLHEPTFDAFDDGFLGIGFSQRFAAGEPLLSGCTERNILAPFDLIALLLQEPQKIVKILGLRDGCIYGGFQLRLPTRALAVCVPLGIAFAPVLAGHYHGQAVFFAQTVTGAPDVGITLSVGNILALVHHIHSTEEHR